MVTDGAGSSSTARGRPPSPVPSCCSCWPSRCSASASGSPTRATSPRDTTTRQAYDLLVEGFGPGFNGPVRARRRGRWAGRPGRARRDHRRPWPPTRASPGCTPPVTDAQLRQFRGEEPGEVHAYVWQVTPTTSAAGRGHQPSWWHRLRDQVLVPGEAALGAEIAVTGQVPGTVDFSGLLAGRMPYFFLAVLVRVVPADDGGVPLGARAAEGRDHEPAVDRGRLRRHGGPRAVGVAQRHHRAARPDRSRRSRR